MTGEPLPQLPNGYEVREHPASGQVVIRKFKPSLIRSDERQRLEDAIRRKTSGLLFVVDVEERALVVYTSEMHADVAAEGLAQAIRLDAAAARRMKVDFVANAHYEKMLRFTLIDEEGRLFNMERWCFRGSIDDWIFIASGQSLAALAEKYVQHLGKESLLRFDDGDGRMVGHKMFYRKECGRNERASCSMISAAVS